MHKAFASNAVFVVSYLALMLPTYYFQHVNASPTILAISLLGLCWLCVVRGTYIGKRWLAVLPIVAMAFELIPRLSAIPYVSTSYHILAIIIGIAFPVMVKPQSTVPNS